MAEQHQDNIRSVPAHEDHEQMLDHAEEHTEAPVPHHMDLKPKQPKKPAVKHVTDLPEPEAPQKKSKKETSEKKKKSEKSKAKDKKSKQTKEDQKPKRKEEKKDFIPKADQISPTAFKARRDPFSIDFEKIALQRSAKQAEFRRKYDDQ